MNDIKRVINGNRRISVDFEYQYFEYQDLEEMLVRIRTKISPIGLIVKVR